MIKYSLICDKGHEFEGWFQNSSAFDKLAKAKQLTCEICGSIKVAKAIMAPRVHSMARPKVSESGPEQNKSEHSKHLQDDKDLREAFKKVRQYVKQNAEYVGPRFAEEARKIHYNESENRGIYGEATVKEVKELAEEGVPVQPLPHVPEELN